MSTGSKACSDRFDALRAALESTPRNYEFLAEYVRELELYRHEEDTFLRLAFRDVNSGRGFAPHATFVVSVVSEMYEPLSPEEKLAARRLWHEKVRGQAEQFENLRKQLSKLT